MTRYKNVGDELPYLLFLAVMFVCGCAIGRFISSNLSGAGLTAAQKVSEMLLNGNSGLTNYERLFNSVSSVAKLPMLVLLLSFSTAGKFAIGPLFALKGFLITFFAGCMLSVIDTGAITAALCSILPSCIFSLPCMLLLAISGRQERVRINHGRVRIPSSVRYLFLLIPAILSDMYLCPFLLRAFCA